MKNKFFYVALAAVALCLAFTSCDDDSTEPFIKVADLEGTWYSPATNEEVKYTRSNRFYDRYTLHTRAEYVEGTFEVDGNKLTERHSFNGDNLVLNLTISNFIDQSEFTITSPTTGSQTFYYISEIIQLEPGKIAWASNTLGDIPDERIVKKDGLKLTATGQKGTVYIKNAYSDTYTKVIVGEETTDLWYDYSILLDASLSTVSAALGQADQSQDNLRQYVVSNTHDYIDHVNVFFEESNKVEQIDIHLKNTASSTEVRNYLESKYFKLSSDNLYGTQYIYFSNSTEDASTFMIGYDTSDNVVFYIPISSEEETEVPNLTNLFGKNKSSLISNQNISESDIISQSTDSLKYKFSRTGYSKFDYVVVYFRGKGKLANSLAIHHTANAKTEDIDASLRKQYTFVTQTTLRNTTAYMYSNTNYSVTVFYYPTLRRIEFYDLTQDEEETSPLPNYTSYFGKPISSVTSALGKPFYEKDNYKGYSISNANVYYVLFRYDDSQNVDAFVFQFEDDANTTDIIDYLNKTYYTQGTNTWSDKKSKSDSSIAIRYNKDSNSLSFLLL